MFQFVFENQEKQIEELRNDYQSLAISKHVNIDNGLDQLLEYANLPKGLIPFHSYSSASKTAFLKGPIFTACFNITVNRKTAVISSLITAGNIFAALSRVNQNLPGSGLISLLSFFKELIFFDEQGIESVRVHRDTEQVAAEKELYKTVHRPEQQQPGRPAQHAFPVTGAAEQHRHGQCGRQVT